MNVITDTQLEAIIEALDANWDVGYEQAKHSFNKDYAYSQVDFTRLERAMTKLNELGINV